MQQEIEEEKVQLAQQLLTLSTNVLKVRTMIMVLALPHATTNKGC